MTPTTRSQTPHGDVSTTPSADGSAVGAALTRTRRQTTQRNQCRLRLEEEGQEQHRAHTHGRGTSSQAETPTRNLMLERRGNRLKTRSLELCSRRCCARRGSRTRIPIGRHPSSGAYWARPAVACWALYWRICRGRLRAQWRGIGWVP